MMRQTGFGCGCEGRCGSGPIVARAYAAGPPPSDGMGGIFELALNAAGSFVGNPALGSQIASTAAPAWGKIKDTPQEMAARVSPRVVATLQSGAFPDPATISQQSQQIAANVLAQVAADLAAQGIYLPPGTVGADLQNPSYLNAFGGEYGQWVLVGGLALGALLVLKEF